MYLWYYFLSHPHGTLFVIIFCICVMNQFWSMQKDHEENIIENYFISFRFVYSIIMIKNQNKNQLESDYYSINLTKSYILLIETDGVVIYHVLN